MKKTNTLPAQCYDELDRMPADVLYQLMCRTVCTRQFLARYALSASDRNQMLALMDHLWKQRSLHDWLISGRHSVPGVVNQCRMLILVKFLIEHSPGFCRIRKKDLIRHLCHGAHDVVPFNPFLLSEVMMHDALTRRHLGPVCDFGPLLSDIDSHMLKK